MDKLVALLKRGELHAVDVLLHRCKFRRGAMEAEVDAVVQISHDEKVVVIVKGLIGRCSLGREPDLEASQHLCKIAGSRSKPSGSGSEMTRHEAQAGRATEDHPTCHTTLVPYDPSQAGCNRRLLQLTNRPSYVLSGEHQQLHLPQRVTRNQGKVPRAPTHVGQRICRGTVRISPRRATGLPTSCSPPSSRSFIAGRDCVADAAHPSLQTRALLQPDRIYVESTWRQPWPEVR